MVQAPCQMRRVYRPPFREGCWPTNRRGNHPGFIRTYDSIQIKHLREYCPQLVRNIVQVTHYLVWTEFGQFLKRSHVYKGRFLPELF